MISRKIDPEAYRIAEAIISKYTGTMFLEGQIADAKILEQANKELKTELIKREIPDDMIELELDDGFGIAPSKFSIKFIVSNSRIRGNKQITFYDELC